MNVNKDIEYEKAQQINQINTHIYQYFKVIIFYLSMYCLSILFNQQSVPNIQVHKSMSRQIIQKVTT